MISSLNSKIISYLPSQPDFEFQTDYYTEQKVRIKPKQPSILFYQFKMGEESSQISVIPDGCIDILINCDQHYGNICGSVTKSRVINLLPNSTYFGIRFLPCLDIKKFGIKDLTDKEVSLNEMFPVNTNIIEKVVTDESFTERVNIFNEILRSQIFEIDKSSKLIKQALYNIYEKRGNITIAQLAEEVGYSTRYLRKLFEDHIGISPKLFSQIVRFQSSLNMLLRTTHYTLNDVIYENGYYDQAHLIHEFRNFGNMTPYQLTGQKSCLKTS
ncbi:MULTISPECIES: helix-turn-helix transcriptional regulator [Lysinibacillus]|uniref:helix-turn-helix transcriptional regulator n=1 Tax=Lysinibacillus TaxID=400634 RepID=UPI00083C984A|nr:helix-turn-helix transcriptional regulator [Lysinibacillus xylanilyticus]